MCRTRPAQPVGSQGYRPRCCQYALVYFLRFDTVNQPGVRNIHRDPAGNASFQQAGPFYRHTGYDHFFDRRGDLYSVPVGGHAIPGTLPGPGSAAGLCGWEGLLQHFTGEPCHAGN